MTAPLDVRGLAVAQMRAASELAEARAELAAAQADRARFGPVRYSDDPDPAYWVAAARVDRAIDAFHAAVRGARLAERAYQAACGEALTEARADLAAGDDGQQELFG